MVFESGPELESRAAEKAAGCPEWLPWRKDPPTIPLCSDNRPVVGRRTQTKTTLSLSSYSPYSLYLYPSFDFLCGQPTGISNPKIPEPLPVSLLLSIPPSSVPLLPVLPTQSHRHKTGWLGKLYMVGVVWSKRNWFVQKPGRKKVTTLLNCQGKYILTSRDLILSLFVGSTSAIETSNQEHRELLIQGNALFQGCPVHSLNCADR